MIGEFIEMPDDERMLFIFEPGKFHKPILVLDETRWRNLLKGLLNSGECETNENGKYILMGYEDEKDYYSGAVSTLLGGDFEIKILRFWRDQTEFDVAELKKAGSIEKQAADAAKSRQYKTGLEKEKE